uniref:Uncharacterized protein n=1 Tax=Megaselia scalaris TaxID=36166 RepID=T1GSY8_MEGSC
MACKSRMRFVRNMFTISGWPYRRYISWLYHNLHRYKPQKLYGVSSFQKQLTTAHKQQSSKGRRIRYGRRGGSCAKATICYKGVVV